MPTYDVVDRRTNDAPVKTEVELHAVVSGTITELGLRQLLQKLYDEAVAAGGFKYHGGKPTNVFIYLYMSKEHFNSGAGQWIAMLSKGGEDDRINILVRTELIRQLDATPEAKKSPTESATPELTVDLPEAKRQEIFRAGVAAQDRADAEATSMYPLPDPGKPGYQESKVKEQLGKQSQEYERLRKIYELEVTERYGITQKQLEDIYTEGLTKNWPLPMH